MYSAGLEVYSGDGVGMAWTDLSQRRVNVGFFLMFAPFRETNFVQKIGPAQEKTIQEVQKSSEVRFPALCTFLGVEIMMTPLETVDIPDTHTHS